MNNILSGSWWWWQSVNSNLTAPTSSHVSAAAKYRLTVHNRPTAGPDPVTKKPSDSDFWCHKITKLYHYKLSTKFCQCQSVMTVSTKTKHTKATISNPNPTHSGCNTLHSSTNFIKICTLVTWMELDYVLHVVVAQWCCSIGCGVWRSVNVLPNHQWNAHAHHNLHVNTRHCTSQNESHQCTDEIRSVSIISK